MSAGWLGKTVLFFSAFSQIWIFMGETKELLCGIVESNAWWANRSLYLVIMISIMLVWSWMPQYPNSSPFMQRIDTSTKFWGSNQRFAAGTLASWPKRVWWVTSAKGYSLRVSVLYFGFQKTWKHQIQDNGSNWKPTLTKDVCSTQQCQL